MFNLLFSIPLLICLAHILAGARTRPVAVSLSLFVWLSRYIFLSASLARMRATHCVVCVHIDIDKHILYAFCVELFDVSECSLSNCACAPCVYMCREIVLVRFSIEVQPPLGVRPRTLSIYHSLPLPVFVFTFLEHVLIYSWMNINLIHVACMLVCNLSDIYLCLVDRSTKNETKHKKMNDET